MVEAVAVARFAVSRGGDGSVEVAPFFIDVTIEKVRVYLVPKNFAMAPEAIGVQARESLYDALKHHAGVKDELLEYEDTRVLEFELDKRQVPQAVWPWRLGEWTPCWLRQEVAGDVVLYRAPGKAETPTGWIPLGEAKNEGRNPAPKWKSWGWPVALTSAVWLVLMGAAGYALHGSHHGPTGDDDGDQALETPTVGAEQETVGPDAALDTNVEDKAGPARETPARLAKGTTAKSPTVQEAFSTRLSGLRDWAGVYLKCDEGGLTIASGYPTSDPAPSPTQGNSETQTDDARLFCSLPDVTDSTKEISKRKFPGFRVVSGKVHTMSFGNGQCKKTKKCSTKTMLADHYKEYKEPFLSNPDKKLREWVERHLLASIHCLSHLPNEESMLKTCLKEHHFHTVSAILALQIAQK